LCCTRTSGSSSANGSCQGQLLPREARRSRPRQVARQRLEVGAPLALRERMFELELAVEMVLDDGLVAAGDEDEMLDAGLARLVDHMLDQRPVDHRQHLLRHGLGGRQEPGAQPGEWKDRFANGGHGSIANDGVNRETGRAIPANPGR
jgi:hypothetical protein